MLKNRRFTPRTQITITKVSGDKRSARMKHYGLFETDVQEYNCWTFSLCSHKAEAIAKAIAEVVDEKGIGIYLIEVRCIGGDNYCFTHSASASAPPPTA